MNQDPKNDKPAETLADAELDALFAVARDEIAEPLPVAFHARLMADAEAMAAQHVANANPPGVFARLAAMLAEFGGIPGLASVSAAGVAGVWIGFSGPGVTGDLVAQFWQGAATVSPTVSTWVDDRLLTQSDDTLLALMAGEGE